MTSCIIRESAAHKRPYRDIYTYIGLKIDIYIGLKIETGG